jgi:23S rRNA (adenine2030-N6)-methyltransferase
MNYRHAYHAGNFADCMKHALLVWLVQALQCKPAPIGVLDTHAGAGIYDLESAPARRTGEWRAGIDRLFDRPPAALAPYVDLVRRFGGLYPGSPALIRAMLRPGDRLVCCELHPEEFFELRRRFGRDKQVALHQRDGWEALRGLLPPKERRGLVLIDPPFEQPEEFATLAQGLCTGYARFPTGVFAAWYPIKHLAPVRGFHTALRQSGIRNIVALELRLREPLDPAVLNGCGLLILNPPHRLADEAPALLGALQERLAGGRSDAGIRVTQIVDE